MMNAPDGGPILALAFAVLAARRVGTALGLTAVQALVPMGLRIALKDIYKAFRFRVPDNDDPCLTDPVGAAPASGHAIASSGSSHRIARSSPGVYTSVHLYRKSACSLVT